MFSRLIWLVPFLLVALAFPVSADLADDTISYFTFDTGSGTTAVDSVGNQNGSFNSTWTVDGVINGGVDFAVSDGWVNYGSNITISEGAFVFWIEPNSTDSAMFLVTNRPATGNDWFQIAFEAATNRLNFIVREGDGTTHSITSADNSILANNRYQVIAQWGTGGMELYINNTLAGSDAFTGWTSRSDDVYIGGTTAFANQQVKGVGDEWGFFSKKLNSSERSFLYASGSPTEEQQYPFESAIAFSKVRVLDLYDNASLSGLNVTWTAQGVTNTTDGSGVATCSNCSGDLSYVIDGGALYFNDSGTGIQNDTVTDFLFGARYEFSANNSFGGNISSFSVESGIQTNSTSSSSLFLVLKPNSSVDVNFSAVGYENRTVTFNTGGRDLSSKTVTLDFDLDLNVSAVNINNLSETITGLCASVSNGSFSTQKCNTTSDVISFDSEFAQGTYNVTVSSVGVGDNVSSSWTSNTTEFSLSGDESVNLTVEPLTLSLTFLDEDNRTSLAGLNISVSVIDSAGTTTDYVTDTGEINITAELTEGDYTVRYTAPGYSTRDFFFTLSLDEPVTQETLYLLFTGELTPGLVTVLAYDGTPLQGATVTMSRYYGNSSIPNQVQAGLTDSQGEVTFVAKSVTAFYSFVVEVNDVVVYSDDNPQLLTVRSDGLWYKTINTVATGVDRVSENTGFNFSFSPKGTLTTNELVNFSFSVSSSEWNVTSCVLNVLDNDGVVVATTSGFCSSTGGTGSVSYNVSNSSRFFTSQALVSTSDFTNTYEQMYSVFGFVDNRFTLKDLADDISGFSGSGFGDFTRFVIALLVIVLVTFSLGSSTNFLNNPEELLVFMFAISLFFSYLGWLRIDIPGIPIDALKDYLLSVLIGFFAVVTALRKGGTL